MKREWRSIFVAFSSVVLACAAPPPSAAQPAHTPPGDTGTVLHLTERAERAVRRNRLTAALEVTGVDADPKRLQAEINRRMAAAAARAKEVPAVAAETTGYSVYQERPEKAPARWVGRQGLRLQGRDIAAVLDLAGALQQQGLVLSGLTADLSPEALRSVEDDLTTEALERLKQRADRIAADLHTHVERYRDLQVGNAGTSPPVIRAMTAMAPAPMAAPPPVAEPGDATVSVVVNAAVMLAPTGR